MERSLLVIGLLAFVAACKKDPRITDVTCEAGDVAGVTKVSWKTELEGDARVEYGLAKNALDTTSPGVPAADQEETLLGLKVATDYFVKVVVDSDGEEEASEVIECTTEPPPVTAPPFVVNTWNPDLACEDGGYVLLNYLGDHESGVGIVDRDGRYVWAVESDADVQYARARLGRDGRSILWNTNDYDHAEDIATVERMSIDGSTTTSTRTLNAHHDFLELPDGSMAYAAYEFVEVGDIGPGRRFDPEALGFPVAAQATEDPEGGLKGGDWDDYRLAYDRIYEVAEGAVESTVPTVVFDHLEDWPEGIYHNHFSAFEKCDKFLAEHCELGHANSLAYVAADDRYTLGLRWLDAFVNVDRAGAVQWVLGGPASTLTGPADELPIHAHFSEAWAGGMLVYDNRDNDPPTRLVEYAIDDAAEAFSAPWTYTRPLEPGEEPAADKVLGDVRRIPLDGCDNVLVSWSSDGILQELTRDGEIVWEAAFTVGNITGRAQYLSSVYDFADQAYPE